MLVNSPHFFPGKISENFALTGGPSRVATGLLTSVDQKNQRRNWDFGNKDAGKLGFHHQK
jgi:hypothetical protein